MIESFRSCFRYQLNWNVKFHVIWIALPDFFIPIHLNVMWLKLNFFFQFSDLLFFLSSLVLNLVLVPMLNFQPFNANIRKIQDKWNANRKSCKISVHSNYTQTLNDFEYTKPAQKILRMNVSETYRILRTSVMPKSGLNFQAMAVAVSNENKTYQTTLTRPFIFSVCTSIFKFHCWGKELNPFFFCM